MADAVTIGNLALSHIGTRTTIESLTENSAEAKEINLWYTIALDQALAAHDWSFARKRLVLATHSDSATDEWYYRYQYPSDCIQARRVENPFGGSYAEQPFEVVLDSTGVAKSVQTDIEDAVLVYTFRQTAASLYSPYFVIMLSYLLAHYISYKLTGKQTVADRMLNIYTNMALVAPAVEYNESMARPPREAEHIRER